ncbi:MAG: hypothetical protein P8Q86_04840 [Polaribacter sp.]|jgi:hypothetical protein|nr:hypothetical protein [Polaribacter sp.]MDG2074252.1 hypothetical protein [Polaribacter sp.]
MDLDTYKKSWKNQPKETSTVSSVDIYKMSHSKSSSVVKWIFIIGLLEVAFWGGLNLLVPDDYMKVYTDFNLINFLNYYFILHYVVIALFLVLFYKNYTSVSAVENTKTLMNKILRVRKTVKYYVYYNLGGFVLVTIIVNSVMFSNPEILAKTMNPEKLNVDINTLLSVTLITQIVAILIMLLILWLFYKVTYGTLLKKLNKNYIELDNLEHLN